MPERLEMESPQQQPNVGAWRGYGLLAAAWLVVLGAGGLAGWLVHTGADADRPVRTAALHTDTLPEPPTATDQAGALDPRFRQIATREADPAGLTSRTAAAASPTATAPGDAPATPAIPRIPAGGGQSDGDTHANGDAAPSEDGSENLSDEPSPNPTAENPIPENPTAENPSAENPSAETPTAEPSPDRTRVQVAARTDAPERDTVAAGPMPPPVPRSIVSAPFGGAQAGSTSRYSVQVGAFRLRENAVERAAQLSGAGYDVRIVHAFATHSRLYMVRLGEFDTRPAAMAFSRQLARDVAVETWPVRN